MENILKLLMLLAAIYLITSCYNCNASNSKQEKFNNILTLNTDKPVDLAMYVNDVSYSFISFDQLKDEYKKTIISALEKNNQFTNNENLNDVKNGILIKTPVFIVKTIDVEKLVNGKQLEFIIVPNGVPNFALVPVINSNKVKGKYLYYNPVLDMLYYTKERTSEISNIINITNDGFAKKFNIISDPEFSNLNLYILNPTQNESNINVRLTQSS